MMPLDLFAQRCFSGLNLLTFLLYGAFGAAMLLIPYVLITSGGYSPVQAGLAMLPLPVLMTTVLADDGQPCRTNRAAHSADHRPARRRARGCCCRGFAQPHSSYWAGIFPAIARDGAGMTIAVAPLTSSVLGSVEEQHVAMASGFNSAVARTGGLIATALLGAVLASRARAVRRIPRGDDRLSRRCGVGEHRRADDARRRENEKDLVSPARRREIQALAAMNFSTTGAIFSRHLRPLKIP